MAWCPNCKAEYVEGIGQCADCDVNLVDVLKTDIDEQPIEGYVNEEYEVFLVSTANYMEYNIIKSMLEAEGIMTLRKTAGAGGYLSIVFGDTHTGIDVYVISSELDRAKEILRATIIIESENEHLGNDNPYEVTDYELQEEDSDKTRKLFKKLIFLIPLALILIIAVAVIYNIYFVGVMNYR